MWYCRGEIQLRQAMFFSAASIAGAFSGLLAFAIGKMNGVGGLEGWRWIFILEGIVTVVVAIAAFWLLYDFPETAGFLTQEERDFVVLRLKYQGQAKTKDDESTQNGGAVQPLVEQSEEFSWAYVKQAFVDWQIWVNIFVYWGVCSCCITSASSRARLTFSPRSSAHFTASVSFYRPSLKTWDTPPAKHSS